jgi:endonuclease/exonuclease/phosphatase family metal-dependent hydrolase
VVLYIAICIVALLIGIFLFAVGGIQRWGVIGAEVITNPQFLDQDCTKSSLKIISWNISFAQGEGSGGERYTPRSEIEMKQALDGIASFLKSQDPDIILLQEIDFDSKRSYYTDQLNYLSNALGYRYSAKALSWKAGYIPYPYFPIKNQFGKIRSGGAVISKWPINSNSIFLHPKPDTHSWWYNAFYLFRYSQVLSFNVAGKTFSAINNHLEAFAAQNRQLQAQKLIEIIGENHVEVAFIGGDFNTIPRDSKVKSFIDGDNYEFDETYCIFESMKDFREIVPHKEYIKSEKSYFTFPAKGPNRRLDYIFVNSKYQFENVEFHHPGEMSDHLPISVEILL